MYDVVILGGGLAGLTCAISLVREGISVCVIEKNQYPFHKVCGEFISNEVLPFLKSIDADPLLLNPVKIQKLILSSPSGNTVKTELPLGAFGISRYTLDNFLFQEAKRQGVVFLLNERVEKSTCSDGEFLTTLTGNKTVKSKLVIGAFGKRSNLDRILKRPFFIERSDYMGIKYHLSYDMPEDTVFLHNFNHGYCGVSKIEDGKVNLCYLTKREQFKKHQTTEKLEKEVLQRNPHLKEIFNNSHKIFNEPLVINEISFAPKKPVENNILMIGDAAGLIPPLTGNGMAMAIHSAFLLSKLIKPFMAGKSDKKSLDQNYTMIWNNTFKTRLFVGRKAQNMFGKTYVSELSLGVLKTFPFILPFLIKKTSGNPFGQQ